MSKANDTGTLTTVGEVIDVLGTTRLMRLAGARKANTVSMWKMHGRMPARTYLVIYAELLRRGLDAPPALWGMLDGREPPPAKKVSRR